MDCMPVRHFRGRGECGMLLPIMPDESSWRSGVFRMPKISIVASALLATTLLGAGAFAATSDRILRTGSDAVVDLAIMAQLENSSVGTIGQGAGAAEKVADA